LIDSVISIITWKNSLVVLIFIWLFFCLLKIA